MSETTGAPSSGQQMRKTARVDLAVQVVIRGLTRPLTVWNLSEDGFFVDLLIELPVDSPVRFTLILPHTARARRIPGVGRVARCEPGVGAGIQFVEVAPEDRQIVREFLSELDQPPQRAR